MTCADGPLLGANPLDDVRHARRIRGVMVRGRWLPSEDLERMAQATPE